MKRFFIIIWFFVLLWLWLIIPAKAESWKIGQGWTRENTALEVAFTVASMIDLSQSLYIESHKQYYEAVNPLLPKYPTRAQFIVGINAGAAIHAGISLLLPPKANTFGIDWNPRLWWQSTTLILEVGNVSRNSCLGVGFSF
jgi:hypothetical protein